MSSSGSFWPIPPTSPSRPVCKRNSTAGWSSSAASFIRVDTPAPEILRTRAISYYQFFLGLIGQSHPSLRHVKQRNLAPAILKFASNLNAMRGVEPVARYHLAGRHPRLSTHPRASRRVAICSHSCREVSEKGVGLASSHGHWLIIGAAARRRNSGETDGPAR